MGRRRLSNHEFARLLRSQGKIDKPITPNFCQVCHRPIVSHTMEADHGGCILASESAASSLSDRHRRTR